MKGLSQGSTKQKRSGNKIVSCKMLVYLNLSNIYIIFKIVLFAFMFSRKRTNYMSFDLIHIFTNH